MVVMLPNISIGSAAHFRAVHLIPQVRDYMVNTLKMDTVMSEGLSTFGVITAAQFLSAPFHIMALDQ